MNNYKILKWVITEGRNTEWSRKVGIPNIEVYEYRAEGHFMAGIALTGGHILIVWP